MSHASPNIQNGECGHEGGGREIGKIVTDGYGGQHEIEFVVELGGEFAALPVLALNALYLIDGKGGKCDLRTGVGAGYD